MWNAGVVYANRCIPFFYNFREFTFYWDNVLGTESTGWILLHGQRDSGRSTGSLRGEQVPYRHPDPVGSGTFCLSESGIHYGSEIKWNDKKFRFSTQILYRALCLKMKSTVEYRYDVRYRAPLLRLCPLKLKCPYRYCKFVVIFMRFS